MENIIIIAVANDLVYYSKDGENFEMPIEYLTEIIEELYAYQDRVYEGDGDMVTNICYDLIVPNAQELNKNQLTAVLKQVHKEQNYMAELSPEQLYKLGLLYDKFDYLMWQYNGKYEITNENVLISFWNLHTFLGIDVETEIGYFIFKGVIIPCNFENFAKLFLLNLKKGL